MKEKSKFWRALLGFFFLVATALSQTLQAERPPLNGVRILGEFLGGVVGGFVGGIIGIYYGWNTGVDFLGFIGFPVGSALGVYAIGEIGNETGSWWATLGGSAVGTVASFVLNSYGLFDNLGNDDFRTLWMATCSLSTLGSIIGFNLTRKYEVLTTSRNAILNFKSGQITVSIPRSYFKFASFAGRRTLIQNVDLVRVWF
jgi:hypothetical protein